MSILINLLPDLRQAKLHEQQRRQLVTGISISVWVACAVIVGIMLVVETGQKVVISTLTTGIKTKEDELRAVDGLGDALTAQQHLASLPGLYDRRVYLSKFFSAFSAAAPKGVSINSLSIDAENLLTVQGNAASYGETSKLARALTVSNVQVGVGAGATNPAYFSDVNITNVDYSDKTGVDFTITATMAPGVTSGNK